MVVVTNMTDVHIVHFLSNSLDDETERTFSKFADYAKLWDEVEIPKGRVSDRGSLIVWRTQSEDNLQSSPRRNWSSACGLGSAPKSAESSAKPKNSLRKRTWELQWMQNWIGAKGTLSSWKKASREILKKKRHFKTSIFWNTVQIMQSVSTVMFWHTTASWHLLVTPQEITG